MLTSLKITKDHVHRIESKVAGQALKQVKLPVRAHAQEAVNEQVGIQISDEVQFHIQWQLREIV